MKYCVECRYMYRYLPGDEHPQCLRFREKVERENPVLGVTVLHRMPFCEHERKEGGRCGPDAKEWQKREPPQHRVEVKRESLFDRIFGSHNF